MTMQCDENTKYCAYSGNRTHISGIPILCATITPYRHRHHYTHAHLSIQLFPSEVSEDYYTRPPGIISILMLTNTDNGFTYTCTQRKFNNHTVLACTGFSSWNQCRGCDENGKYCA